MRETLNDLKVYFSGSRQAPAPFLLANSEKLEEPKFIEMIKQLHEFDSVWKNDFKVEKDLLKFTELLGKITSS